MGKVVIFLDDDTLTPEELEEMEVTDDGSTEE